MFLISWWLHYNIISYYYYYYYYFKTCTTAALMTQSYLHMIPNGDTLEHKVIEQGRARDSQEYVCFLRTVDGHAWLCGCPGEECHLVAIERPLSGRPSGARHRA